MPRVTLCTENFGQIVFDIHDLVHRAIERIDWTGADRASAEFVIVLIDERTVAVGVSG